MTNSPQPPTPKGHRKDKHFEAQMIKVFAAFKKKPSTMLMVAKTNGIDRANICRYVAIWYKQGKIQLLKYGYCKVSKRRAGYLTTNQALFNQTLPLL